MFFFSSRRRHTRWPRDWSSDVCSSDLAKLFIAEREANYMLKNISSPYLEDILFPTQRYTNDPGIQRSEERRVGKEWRSEWATRGWKDKANRAASRERDGKTEDTAQSQL